MATVEEAIAALDKLCDEARTLSNEWHSSLFPDKFELWSKRAEAKVREWGLVDEAHRFRYASSNLRAYASEQEHRYDKLQSRVRVLVALREDLTNHPDFYTEKAKPGPPTPSAPLPDPTPKPDRVFLGHGRSLLWTKVERWLEKDKRVSVQAWESEPHAGEQVIEVLERLLDSCTFAVLVVTGEDSTSTGALRARQNVIHEIGLFQGRLGFKKVALLEQDGTESFSNVDGLQTLRFPGHGIETTFPELERMMKREGLVK